MKLSFTKLYFLDFLFFSWILGKVTKIYDRVYEPISISKAEIPHQKLSEDNLQVLIVLNFITCSTDIVQILLFLCSILHVFSPFVFFASFFFDLNLRSDVSYPVLIQGIVQQQNTPFTRQTNPIKESSNSSFPKYHFIFKSLFNFQPSQHNNQQTNEFYVFFFDYLTQKLPTTNVSFTPRR